MGEWVSHVPTTPSYHQPSYTVPNIAFTEPYAHMPQPQQSAAIIGAYAQRNMQNVQAIRTNADQFEEGTANMVYQFGRLHVVPPEQFQGGPTQGYYEQGYNEQGYQQQPPQE